MIHDPIHSLQVLLVCFDNYGYVQSTIWVIHISPLFSLHRIDSEMVSVFVYIMIDRGFDPGSCQTKDYDIGSCCSSAKNAASRSKSKHWLAWSQDKVSRHVYPWTVVSVS